MLVNAHSWYKENIKIPIANLTNYVDKIALINDKREEFRLLFTGSEYEPVLKNIADLIAEIEKNKPSPTYFFLNHPFLHLMNRTFVSLDRRSPEWLIANFNKIHGTGIMVEFENKASSLFDDFRSRYFDLIDNNPAAIKTVSDELENFLKSFDTWKAKYPDAASKDPLWNIQLAIDDITALLK